MSTSFTPWRARAAMVAALLVGIAGITSSLGSGAASAKGGGGGGTAKPPAGSPAPLTPPTWPAVPAPKFSTNTANIHGFDMVGFIQDAKVDPTLCPNVPAGQVGGSLVINGTTVIVPCFSVVQMPANTLSWTESIDLATAQHQSLALDRTGSGASNGPSPYPSFEAHVVGNIVDNRYIAGLVFLSQQAANAGQGVVQSIDYSTGELLVAPSATATAQVRLQLNDPNGRFGRAQSPDDRFSVDDENPTVHSGTGYPMCIPRTDPAVTDDPLCPQRNRPMSTQQAACRNWTAAGVTLPAAGQLPVTPVGQRCRNYVMKDPSLPLAATDPDARQQAPIEPGDCIAWSGTLFHGANGAPDFVSVHTLEDNVGLYTQPGTLPSYVAIGEFGVGSADPSTVSVNGAVQEVQDRIFLEAQTTDVKAPVDIYMVDIDPTTGAEINRWITPFEMTGENNGPLVPSGTWQGLAIGGGITTQNTGAQVQRVRLRATKAPTGVLGSPTRTLRVVSRTQCVQPRYILNSLTATSTVPSTAIASAGNVVLPTTGAPVPAIDASSTTLSAPSGSVRVANKPCLDSTPVANGLRGGSYTAPVFDVIFPENVSVGEPIVPFDFWDLGFLVNGEGPGTGQLLPRPW